jgi:serine/threonine-protein kinase
MTELPEVGDQIASYRIQRRLGEGGMAVVYLAEDVVLDRLVALKLIQPRMADEVRFRDRFLRESRLAARLEHPHIVPVYSAGEQRGLYYIAMRYIRGGDLETLLESPGHRSTPMDTELALSILEPVADALDTAHNGGLVHRDVKPANILLEQRAGGYEVFLSDFGIAKAMEGTRYTVDGDVLGTPSYIAPEQARGEVVDARTDVYALACVAFRCLTGAPPFVRDNPLAVMAAHSTEPPPRLSDFRPALASLDGVFESGLAKEGRDRPNSCSELVAALRRELPPAGPVRQRTATVDAPALEAQLREAATGPGSDGRTGDPGRDDGADRFVHQHPGERSGWTVLLWYLLGLVGIVVVAFFAGRLLLADDDTPADGGTGQEGAPETEASPDPAPTDVTAERTAGGVLVTWTDNTENQRPHVVIVGGPGVGIDDGQLEPVPSGERSVELSNESLAGATAAGSDLCFVVATDASGQFAAADEVCIPPAPS